MWVRQVQMDAEGQELIRKKRLRKAMALKDDIGLTDDERHELANFIFGQDCPSGSWKDLNPKQLHDLLCYMEGFLFIVELLNQRD